MGEDERTHGEPGCVTGSMVPPPAIKDEPPQIRPPLPRRQPKASGHQRAVDADRLMTPIRLVAQPGPTNLGPSQPRQRRLQLAEPPATTPPQLPDDVRYLFKPVLTRTALAAAPDDAEVEPDADSRTGERASAPRTSAGSAGSHRRSAAGGAGSKLRRRLIGVAAVLVASTAVGTAFALVKHGSAATPPGQQGAGARHSTPGSGWGATPGLSSADIRAQAARWVAREVSKSAIIACDDVMCAELLSRGIAASNLLVLSPVATSPLGADVVIGTPALRSQFGQRLARKYAPTVIASFGVGMSRVDVRVVAPDGAAAYELAQSRDLAARQRYGGVLLSDSRISVAASAKPDLIAGLVDPRLLVMLPVLANQHQIRILGFYDRAPASAQGVPLSGAELAGYDAAAGLSADSYVRWLLVFLRGQRAPYWPTSVTTTLVFGHEIVRVQFSRPSPIGFLNGR